jgi:hypothetical protein
MKAPLSIMLLAASTLIGCKSKESGAREAFSKEFTCPADRVEVRERPDVKMSMLRETSKPPADVAADPGRLAMWNAEQEKSRTNADGLCEMFEARGCNQQTLMCCSRPPKHADRITCIKHAYANGVSRW